MVGGPCRTAIEHRARPTQVTVEDRMERATRCVVGAQYAMVYRAMAHRASSRKTFCVKLKKVPSHYVFRQVCCG
jgi:hypothetical protein